MSNNSKILISNDSKEKYSPVKPEVAPAFAEDCLVIVVDFLMADAAGVDGGSIGVLGVEHHGLIGRVDLPCGDRQGLRRHSKHVHM